MKKTYEFKEQFDKGAVGVKIVEDYLRNCPDYVKLYDLGKTGQLINAEDDMTLQKEGVDLLIKYGNDKTVKIEVKSDTYEKNVFLELMSVIEKDKDGWLFTSNAHLLAYYFETLQKLYVFPLEMLRNWYQVKHKDDLIKKKLEKKVCRNKGYHSLGCIVEKDYLVEQVNSYITNETNFKSLVKVYDLNETSE